MTDYETGEPEETPDDPKAARNRARAEAKAKSVRPIVEKLVTISREDTLHHRRLVMAKINDQRATDKLFDVLGPRFEGQPGGYTRIYKTEPRHGDAAPMAIIEFIA